MMLRRKTNINYMDNRSGPLIANDPVEFLSVTTQPFYTSQISLRKKVRFRRNIKYMFGGGYHTENAVSQSRTPFLGISSADRDNALIYCDPSPV